MPGTKRTTKAVSHGGHNDDDDFVPANEPSKKARPATKSDQTESKSSERAAPRSRRERLTKSEQAELDLALSLSKGTVQAPTICLPRVEVVVINDDAESTTSERQVSSNESKTTTAEEETEEQDENSLPKSKRMKREESLDSAEENHDDDDDEEEEVEEEEPIKTKKATRKSAEIHKATEVPTVTSISLNPSRSTTRGQTAVLVSTSDPSSTKSAGPIGFPTSKISIPSSHASRVGLSRKSSAIKPLHRNLNQRAVHE